MKRRTFLKVLGGAGAAAAAAGTPIFPAFAGPEIAQDEYFIFIHASLCCNRCSSEGIISSYHNGFYAHLAHRKKSFSDTSFDDVF